MEETKVHAAIQNQIESLLFEYDGICAAAALAALSRLFCFPIDIATLTAGEGIRFGSQTDAALCAFTGTSLFISYAAHHGGLPREQLILLCEEWQRYYELHADIRNQKDPGESSFTAVLFRAHAFIEERRQLLGLGIEVAKPRQYYDNIYDDRESMFKHSPYALEEKLTKAVTKGEETLALAVLREITAHGEKAVLAKDPLRSAKNSMIGSIAFLARAAIQAGVSANDAFALSDALTQKVEEMRTRSTVLAFEENILLQYITLVRRRLETAYSAPIVRVMHYVENHLDAKISLNDAAAYAGVHPAYLSGRFKQEASLSFTGYVAMRKIQESTYFVRHTDYPISQIAYLYGFSSQSYYITTFKKVMHTTPVKYRCQLLS